MMTETSTLGSTAMVGTSDWDAQVCHSANGLSVGGVIYDTTTWHHHWPGWYPSGTFVGTVSVYPQPSKFEQAFKVASMLLEKKLVKEPTLRAFVGLVNDIAAAL